MKILVVADTHYVTAPIITQLKKEKADMLFFLGDFVQDGEDIKRKLQIPAYIIAGNGDMASFYKRRVSKDKRQKNFIDSWSSIQCKKRFTKALLPRS